MRGKRKAAAATKSKCSASCCTDSEKTTEISEAGSSVQNKARHNSDRISTNDTLSISSANLEPNLVNMESESDSTSEETISNNNSNIVTATTKRGRTSRGQTRNSKKKRKRSPPPSRDSSDDIDMASSTSGSSSESESDIDLLDDVLKSNVHDLTGNEGQSFSPLDAPISSQISKRIQRRIWKNKFVDFGSLLPVSWGHDQDTSPMHLSFNHLNGKLNLVPSVKKQKIYNIDQWTTAFMRFVAIYTLKFPSETPALMKYGELVRDLAAKNNSSAWSRYDFQFRSLREQTPIPWDRMHTEFWVRATTTTVMQPFRQNHRPYGYSPNGFRVQNRSKPMSRGEFLPNTCWPFNRRGFCNSIKCFPHICGYCRGQHSAKSCPNSQKQDSSVRPNQQYQPGPVASNKSQKSK